VAIVATRNLAAQALRGIGRKAAIREDPRWQIRL